MTQWFFGEKKVLLWHGCENFALRVWRIKLLTQPCVVHVTVNRKWSRWSHRGVEIFLPVRERWVNRSVHHLPVVIIILIWWYPYHFWHTSVVNLLTFGWRTFTIQLIFLLRVWEVFTSIICGVKERSRGFWGAIYRGRVRDSPGRD